ncbi:MAG: hypothetical protein OEM67_02465 [Thermoleophilia bacterium]|nr:hypothetical protein [Thermoleophilia bacterium]MDH3725596.1 hypothetical protein [Thermoleophilia bacterium]
MARRPVVFVHGYGTDERGFGALRQGLIDAGYTPSDLHLVRYVSLSDEVSVRRLADAFELAVQERIRDNSFDTVVHSTGVVIVREWLRRAPEASKRLRHLVALAPANFGSPSAPRARSLAGRAVRGLGMLARGDGGDFITPWSEDFLEVGGRLLHDLELASPISWDLAMDEIEGERWGRGDGDKDVPATFVIGGLSEYDDAEMARRRPGPGTDGTVRISGMGLDIDYLGLDLIPSAPEDGRIDFRPAPERMARPLLVIGLNHASVKAGPSDDTDDVAHQAYAVVKEWLADALSKEGPDDYARWSRDVATASADQIERSHRASWLQFVVRLVDETSRPIAVDWTLELDVDGHAIGAFERGAHTHSEDPSLRCFHLAVTDQLMAAEEATLRVITMPETKRFGYLGVGSRRQADRGASHISAEITLALGEHERPVRLFRRNATTLIQIRLDGRPGPPESQTALLSFVD